MADAELDSPLESAAGAAGPHATEAFALLANETRLAILLALWELHEPGTEDTSVSFSELYGRIDYDNPGNFSYHLEKLEGQFIRKRPDDERYELRKTGLELVRSVIAGSGVQDTSLESTEIDRACYLCGAPTAVSYEDGTVYQVCTECEGMTTRDDLPDGWLNGMKFDPAGLTDRSAEELLAAAEIAAYRHMRTMFAALCSACSGPVDASLEICEDHDSEGVCSTCGRVPEYTAQFQCRACKDFHGTTPDVLCVFHPAVIAFYYEHGVSPRWHADEYDGLTYVGDHEPEHETELVSENPPQVEVTVTLDDEELRVTFDETVSIIDVTW
ncbi:MAG: winged helix-turn-helix domain-containing protein [Halopenitus sp.]